jgi:hypothetical protein
MAKGGYLTTGFWLAGRPLYRRAQTRSGFLLALGGPNGPWAGHGLVLGGAAQALQHPETSENAKF